VYLLHSKVNGAILFRGKCPFILNLDYNSLYVIEVCKSFDAISRGGKMSIKFDSPNIKNKIGQALFMDMLVESFKWSNE
jgi:hypothetical protein